MQLWLESQKFGNICKEHIAFLFRAEDGGNTNFSENVVNSCENIQRHTAENGRFKQFST